ncbi:MAG: UDP-N-acetylmuramoyl-tripeptide--D-alanyl-D-alanine ligase [Candidatus Wolfebacteria bacterium]|nr:UDP-N-acetylmuramoyl-tripeptide--D-alanyl-D-alanine ligase [Candidatus Wolfebacteria bacterium]
MEFLFGIIILGIAALCVKAILFWVYLWQIKEYRLDRFLAEYGDSKKLLKFWIFGGGRSFKQPKWTAKAILIFAVVFAVAVVLALPVPYDLTLPFYLVIYLFSPTLVFLAVFLFKIPTVFTKKIIYFRAARKIAKMKNLTVVGITGSFGKSSTKEFLAQILSRKFRVAKTPANQNTEIGIAKFVLAGLPETAEIFVVEMGAYKMGEIKRICGIVKPQIGILTGIDEQHMALFGSIENTQKAKFELIENLPKDGFAVFNGENKYTRELGEKWRERNHNANMRMYANTANVANVENLPPHYLLNLAGVIEVAKYLGMSDVEIEEAIKRIDFSDKGMKTFIGKNNVLVIDDTYSANPDGVMAALDFLARQPRKYKIIIMPCLIELGLASKEIHRKIGKKIKEVCDLAIITTRDYFTEIKNEAGSKAILENNSGKVKELLKDKLNSDTVILLEGRLSQGIISINPL